MTPAHRPRSTMSLPDRPSFLPAIHGAWRRPPRRRPSRGRLTPAARLAAVFALALALAACSPRDAGRSAATPATPLDQPQQLLQAVGQVTREQLRGVTINVIDGYGQIQLAPAGLADTPYRINPITTLNISDQVALLQSGQADLNVFGDIPFLGVMAGEVPVKIVRALQRPPRNCSIIVAQDSPIQSLAGLKGRPVANSTGLASEVMAIRAFERIGLDYFKDTQVVEMRSLFDARTAFISGKVDAWAGCTEIVATEVLEGRARFLVTGEDGLWSGHNYWGIHASAFEDPARLAALLDYIHRVERSFEWAGRPENIPKVAQTQAKWFQLEPRQSARYLEWGGPTHGAPIDATVIQGLQASYDAEAGLGRLPPGRDAAPFFSDLFNGYFADKARP